ncbi:hypothetical protein pb186bvf_001079 [Paramecium bursaria]
MLEIIIVIVLALGLLAFLIFKKCKKTPQQTQQQNGNHLQLEENNEVKQQQSVQKVLNKQQPIEIKQEQDKPMNHLIDEIGFQLDDDSDQDHDDSDRATEKERGSRELQVFQFQQNENKLEDLVSQSSSSNNGEQQNRSK